MMEPLEEGCTLPIASAESSPLQNGIETGENSCQPSEDVEIFQVNGFASPLEQQAEVESNIDLMQMKAQHEALQHEQEQQWNLLAQERDSYKREILELRNHLMKSEEQWHDKLSKQKSEFDVHLTRVLKERDSMVVKYANSEKEVIVAHNQRDSADKKMKDLIKERDVLLEKIKAMNAEKTRVCNMLEAKCNEYFSSQREIDKMKEEINSREIKVRWAQNKLKSETESHQETQSKYEKCVQQIKQLKDELEEIKRSYNEIKSKESDSRALNEAQLLEERARLIVDKQNLEDQSATYKNALKGFEVMKVRHTQLVEENSNLLAKLQGMQKERSEQEQNINHMKEQVSHQREILIQAQTKLAEMDGVQEQLERERERLSKNQEQLGVLQQSNSDLQEETKRCQAKEAELLEYTQRLTVRSVQLQSDFGFLEEKVKSLEEAKVELMSKLEQTERKWKSNQLELEDERTNRASEGASWTRSLSEKSRLCEDLQTQVRELQNELAAVRRKHAINIKELTRELRVTKKRLEQIESSSAAASVSHSNEVASLGSRTSSSTSINTTGIDHQTPEHSPSPTHAPMNMSPEWERNALLEKMVRVQRDNAKKSEKIDFLEEHVNELVVEVKKKNRILQHYFAKEETGSVVSEASDRHKAEMAKHGGIMSSMYNMKTLDDGLNLELCLEINQKLQSVLEDTLLKNITLKDNLSTLGAEVARMSQLYQSLLQQKQAK